MMTTKQKNDIDRLRSLGLGCRRIATELGISESSVKSYCLRHPVEVEVTQCLHCGEPLKQTPHKRHKRFCSATCRAAWWNEHRGEGEPRKTYPSVCAYCGKSFTSYTAGRHYCSRQCYGMARRKVVSE